MSYGCSEDVGNEMDPGLEPGNELSFEMIDIPTTPDLSLNEKESAIHSEIDEFGLRMLKNMIAEGNGENIALSPVSAVCAAALFENTIFQCYGDHMNLSALIDYDDIDDVNSAFNKLIRFLPDKSHECDMNIGNSVWLNKSIDIPARLKNIANDEYYAELIRYDGQDAEWLAETSRKWVSDKTHGIIDDFGLILNDSRAYTINTIYFNGEWETGFDRNETINSVFRAKNHDVWAEFMTGGIDDVPYLENDHWTAIALPFHGNYEMIFVLPAEGTDLIYAADALKAENRDKYQINTEQLCLELPKFSLNNDRLLNNYLDEQIGAVNIRQITDLKIDEEGATAVAVSIMYEGPGPEHLCFDRPFLFSIVNRVSGTSLMMGAVMNPAAGK